MKKPFFNKSIQLWFGNVVLTNTIHHHIAKSQITRWTTLTHLGFVIYLGLRVHQFQKYHQLSAEILIKLLNMYFRSYS